MSWQPYHFYILLPLLALIILLVTLTRHMTDRAYRRMLVGITILLLLCECVKQILAIPDYAALYLPFHYSTTYYLCLVLYAFGRGRPRHLGTCLFYVSGLLLVGTMLASPTNVIGTLEPTELFSSFYQFYSLFYHIVVLYVWLAMMMRGDYRPARRDPLLYMGFLLSWSALVIPMSRIFDFNYAGLLYSYIPILEKLRLSAGDTCYLITYLGGVLLLATCAIRLYAVYRRHADICRYEAPHQQTLRL